MTHKPWLFLAWAPYGRRSESLAKELGAEMHFVHYLKFQTPAYAPIKYILQGFKTVSLLLSNRPSVVFVQNPPIFCALVVFLLRPFLRNKFVLDHHSDVFSPRWNFILPVQKYLVSRAALNLVTNDHWAEIIRGWGGKAMILEDALPDFPPVPDYEVPAGVNVVMINTFADDEPLDEVVGAARLLPDVTFHVTGNKKKQPPAIFAGVPANVIFTGFLPDQQYIGLLKACNAVMALTTRDHTLQGGGFEAVSLGKPLITSDWPLLRFLFQRGSVYVDNTAEGIANSIVELGQSWENREEEMKNYCKEKRQEYRHSITGVTELL